MGIVSGKEKKDVVEAVVVSISKDKENSLKCSSSNVEQDGRQKKGSGNGTQDNAGLGDEKSAICKAGPKEKSTPGFSVVVIDESTLSSRDNTQEELSDIPSEPVAGHTHLYDVL